MARVSKQDWLNEGLVVLAEQGFAGLTLDNLLSRLAVTHGSFYHHFRNRQAYQDALLGQWEQTMTLDIVKTSANTHDLMSRVQQLIDLGISFKQQTSLEVAIRAQAQQDESVRERVARVDALRIAHCQGLAELATPDPQRARTLGLLVHALFIGTQQVIPAYDDQTVSDIYQELIQLVTLAEKTNTKEKNHSPTTTPA